MEELLDRILREIRASAPPEIQFINDMLDLDDEETMRQALETRQEEITPIVLNLLEQMLTDVRGSGRKAIAGRLQKLYELAGEVAGG
jgi:hypothetical protein